VLGRMLTDKDPQKANAALQAMLKMKKLDIAGLQQAYAQSARV
jgi:predicted 3-demethylubiquinone-9 3-methyltransferase (glyoxalase superfamily)